MTDQFDQIMLSIIGFSFIFQLFYYLYFFIRVPFQKSKAEHSNLPAVSVIIAARNEAENLKKNLPSILNQDYPDFEVIVVNDRSWDKSKDILTEFSQNNSNLKIVNNPDFGKDGFSKKLALTLGIKAAKNECLLFTDADCYVISNKWIKNMSSSFSEKSIVLGASPYRKRKGFLNALIRFDTIFIAVQYMGMALARIPYMGVGRNLGYKKTVYESLSGFKSHYHIPSGDDDLLVNKGSDKKNTAVVFNNDAITLSEPKSTFKEWFDQKSRHLQTGKFYLFKHQLILFLYPLSLIIFYTSSLIYEITSSYLHIGIILVLFRILIQIIIFIRPFKIMGSKDLIIFAPIIELILMFIYPFIQLRTKKTAI